MTGAKQIKRKKEIRQRYNDQWKKYSASGRLRGEKKGDKEDKVESHGPHLYSFNRGLHIAVSSKEKIVDHSSPYLHWSSSSNVSAYESGSAVKLILLAWISQITPNTGTRQQALTNRSDLIISAGCIDRQCICFGMNSARHTSRLFHVWFVLAQLFTRLAQVCFLLLQNSGTRHAVSLMCLFSRGDMELHIQIGK